MKAIKNRKKRAQRLPKKKWGRANGFRIYAFAAILAGGHILIEDVPGGNERTEAFGAAGKGRRKLHQRSGLHLYSKAQSDLIRTRVDDEENYYICLTTLMQDISTEKGGDICEEYRRKYRGEFYLHGLSVSGERTLMMDGEPAIGQRNFMSFMRFSCFRHCGSAVSISKNIILIIIQDCNCRREKRHT